MTLENLLKDLFVKAKVKRKYISCLTKPECISFYTSAFTDPSFDSENNYLYLKTLGTVSISQIIVWYLTRKYPQLTPQKITQLKKNFIEKSKFGEYGQTINFDQYILRDEKLNITHKTIQNVFEAFIGTTELLVNKNFKFGLGYVIVYKICSSILDEIFIYEEELDSKTKLKELLDVYKNILLERNHLRDENNIFHFEIIYQNQKIGNGSAKTIIESEQEASNQALQFFKERGIVKKDKVKKEEKKIQNIYNAPRDKSFVSFILNLLGRVHFLTDLKLEQNDVRIFEMAFTHPDVKPDISENYELLETLGDNTINKCVLWYISNRFPQLNSPDAIDILTKLKISIIKSSSYSELANKLGFFNFISCDMMTLSILNKRSILEDVFESFFAATEMVIDKKYKQGMGYIVCYKLLASILDEQEYSLKYELLSDSKTRLKELLDLQKMIKIKYMTKTDKIEGLNEIYKSIVLEQKAIGKNPDGTYIYGQFKVIFDGFGYDSKEAEQSVSQKVLKHYESIGIKKDIPKEYLKFCM